MEQPTDYADRVHLMQRLNMPMRRTRSEITFTGIAIFLIGVALGTMLLATLRACDPQPSPVPAVRLS